MKNILYKIFIVLLLPAFLSSQDKTVIEGMVKDESNIPMPFVNVFILNSSDGSVSDENGLFSFKTRFSGKVTLIASMVGYEKFSTDIETGVSKKVNLEITMAISTVKLNETIITASSYGSEKEKGLVISRMDILTTPGGATDIYQSLKTMPGLTQVSESAQLYVRGGDPIESSTLINQTVIYHPYTFESAYGGIFSNLDQSSVKSIYFTSGGFSAKYGNALSGVLDIETKNQPEHTRTNIGLSLANGSITSEIAIDPAKFGLYFDARQNFTRPIFWLNGGSDRLTLAPVSKNFTSGIVYNYSKTGRIKLFNIYADDEQGVKVERADYTGNFNGNTKNIFMNLQNTDILFGSVVIKNSLGYNKYSNSWILGVLDIVRTDKVYSFRSDLEILTRKNLKFLAGGEFENRNIKYTGKIPADDYDIKPGASETIIYAVLEGIHYGVYVEIQAGNIFNLKNLSASAGGRYDYFPGLELRWLDPRAGLAYRLDDNSTFRLGWGIFRQLPDPRLFNPTDGNPELKSMKAEHIIASYEYIINDNNSFRAEVYRKIYKNLPMENELLNYDNSGYGFANGMDLIFKGDLPFGITGWISYGYINTKRLWMDYESFTNSTFNISHNLSIVAKYSLSEKFQIGVTAKYATGRPYTPVDSSIFRELKNVYEPVYASTNSSRFPDYKRVDLRLTYFSEILDNFSLVAFVEGINILNFTNIFGYSYSADYKEKKEIESYFGRRMIVTGFSVGF